MLPIKQIHYQIDTDNLTDYFKSNEKEIMLVSDKALVYCNEFGISVGLNSLYAVVENHEIKIYTNKVLVYRNNIEDGFSPASFTEAFIKKSEHKDLAALERSLLTILLASVYLAYMIGCGNMRTKTSRGTYYTIHKIPKSKIVVKQYQNSGALFLVEEKEGKVKFLCNYPEKVNFSLPSDTFRMPNKNEIKCFYPENMMPLEDGGRLDAILKNIEQQPGKCYANAAHIISALQEAKYDNEHTVEYFAGWMYMYMADRLVHHAWVVVDAHSVIDLTVKHSDKLSETYALWEEGKYVPFNRDIAAQWANEELKEAASYSKYHFYGKNESCIYIGTQCTRQEASNSFYEILTKHPELPGYENYNKKGENKYQALYREKFLTK